MGGAVQDDRMNSRDFGSGEDGALLQVIRQCLNENKQFAVTPLPESVTDARHLGWRISWPKGGK